MTSQNAGESRTRFDPRVTILALVVLSITVVVTDDWLVLGGVALVLGAYIAAMGAPPAAVLKSVTAVAWFAGAAMIVSALTVPGKVLVGAGDVYVTQEGMALGLMLSARLALLVSMSTAYVLTVPLVRTMDAIASVVHPLTRGRGNLLVVSGIAIAFVPMLIQTAKRVRAARIARGEPGGKGVVANARFAAAAAVPLFAAVFRSADELAEAMEARGFDPAARRTVFADLRIAGRDRVLIAAIAAWAAVALLVTLRSP
jgi:energy-coupling factor transport system permease protein